MIERAKKYEDADSEDDALREMNDYEKNLMKQFEDNDQEIDEMLDEVINQVDKLKLHAENIGTVIRS